MYLRASTTTTAAGYTSDLSLSKVVPTFARQSVGALPLSYAQINTPSFIQRFPDFIDVRTLRTWIVVVLVVGLLGLALRGMPKIPRRTLGAMLFAGASLWFIPALVVAQTVRWQSEVVWGNAYIPVYVQYFGFALVSLVVVLVVRSIVEKRKLLFRVLPAAVLSVLVVTGTVAASSNNRLAIQQYNPGYLWTRQFFERATERGAFDDLKDGDAVFTPGGQLWFDPAFVAWWDGPRLESIVDAIGDQRYTECVSDATGCAGGFDASFVQYGIYPSEIRAIMVSKKFALTSDGTKFTSLEFASPRVYVELLRSFTLTEPREERCRNWLAARYRAHGRELDPSDVRVATSAGNWCLVDVAASVGIDALTFTPNK
jgi:hypothetical protein